MLLLIAGLCLFGTGTVQGVSSDDRTKSVYLVVRDRDWPDEFQSNALRQRVRKEDISADLTKLSYHLMTSGKIRFAFSEDLWEADKMAAASNALYGLIAATGSDGVVGKCSQATAEFLRAAFAAQGTTILPSNRMGVIVEWSVTLEEGGRKVTVQVDPNGEGLREKLSLGSACERSDPDSRAIDAFTVTRATSYYFTLLDSKDTSAAEKFKADDGDTARQKAIDVLEDHYSEFFAKREAGRTGLIQRLDSWKPSNWSGRSFEELSISRQNEISQLLDKEFVKYGFRAAHEARVFLQKSKFVLAVATVKVGAVRAGSNGGTPELVTVDGP